MLQANALPELHQYPGEQGEQSPPLRSPVTLPNVPSGHGVAAREPLPQKWKRGQGPLQAGVAKLLLLPRVPAGQL